MKEIAVLLMVMVAAALAWERTHTRSSNWYPITYILVSALLALANHSFLLFIDLLLVSKVVYTVVVNKLNTLEWHYVSRIPDNFVDAFHNRVFGLNAKPYIYGYTIAIIILTILL